MEFHAGLHRPSREEVMAWVVTKGFLVIRVFSTKEKAQEYIDKQIDKFFYRLDGYEIDETDSDWAN